MDTFAPICYNEKKKGFFMIIHTFSIAQGIGERLEKHLWRHGILTWMDFIEADTISGIPRERKGYFDGIFSNYQKALNIIDSEFFARNLKIREHWRLFSELKLRALCLDIETNGYQPENGGYVTVVGFYDGLECKQFIRGENLTLANLQKEIDRADLLITFYGGVFDIPFLLRTFPGLKINKPHFDLCFGARRLGLKGGLKRLETYFGIKRDEIVQDLNGYDAVLLWQYYRRGSKEALDLLLEYNKEDTVNLLNLSEIIYEELRRSTGIDDYTVRRTEIHCA
ncbi:MAG: ribonuclease H-like domain-containing protein [Thermodesulfovibrionales bacterium]|nr:ribonuclease H-like domain-containing protein [Thermodesulfovibrionales bacterium]